MTQPKACPICMSFPREHITSLGLPGGRGYPGKSSVYFECSVCKAARGHNYQDISSSFEEARELAIMSYNDRVQELTNHLKRVYEFDPDKLLRR